MKTRQTGLAGGTPAEGIFPLGMHDHVIFLKEHVTRAPVCSDPPERLHNAAVCCTGQRFIKQKTKLFGYQGVNKKLC
ncbi:MAG: hypothetical protein KJ872_06915 [Alphaproteobacteria bacterium]|nr:hypothetical protein [Alphaproteobacteria bacterium]